MIQLNVCYSSACSGVWDKGRKGKKGVRPQRDSRGYHIWGIVCRLLGCRRALSDIVDFSRSNPDHVLSNVLLSFHEDVNSSARDLTRGEKAYYSNCKEAIMPINSGLKRYGEALDHYKLFNLLCMDPGQRKQFVLIAKNRFPEVFAWLLSGGLKTYSAESLDKNQSIPDFQSGDWFKVLVSFFESEESILWNVEINNSFNSELQSSRCENVSELLVVIGFFLLSIAKLQEGGVFSTAHYINVKQLQALANKLLDIELLPDDELKKKKWNAIRKSSLSIVDQRDYPKAVFSDVRTTTQLVTKPEYLTKRDGSTMIWLESNRPSAQEKLEHEQQLIALLKTSGVKCFQYGKKGLGYLDGCLHLFETERNDDAKRLGTLESIEYEGFQ